MNAGKSRYDVLTDRLVEERARLAEVRAAYGKVTGSRFHALRMLWFALKRLLGIASPQDVFAVWSPGAVARLTPDVVPGSDGEGTSRLTLSERRLVEAWGRRMQSRANSEAPTVTVVIPVYDNREMTVRCLQSIADTWFESLDVGFVVVDDGSADGTSDVITRLIGVDYVRSGRNEGFIRACNRGAAIARGKYLCFLNNDTVVRNGWLDYLVTTAEDDAAIGVIGSKLIYPDGRLQEAGGIVWRDATGWNYGRFENPDDPRYNYLREVDYVSGAAMLVRSDLFAEVGGFSERFRPAYYEDADLCFEARRRGYRVVYQPLSEVVHYESATSGDESSGVKRYQEINRPKFREKWAGELAHHLPNKHTNVQAGARRNAGSETILVVDDYVPLYDREAGSLRLFYIVKMLRGMGYSVVFLPDNYAGLQPYTQVLQQMGVEVLHHIDGGRTMEESLDAVLPAVDLAWISRPDLFEKYEPLVRRNAAARVIYDTVDLVHVRKRREAEFMTADVTGWEEYREKELAASRRADATIVVTEDEKRILEELGASNVFVVPTIHEHLVGEDRSFEGSSGLLFIGNYNHPPNVDAVSWLCDAVMPLVWKNLPNVLLTLVGSNPSDKVIALQSDRVRVTGYVRDVAPYFTESRIFVAPIRFGAGMKGKIGQALSYSLPVVTTPVGAEGLGLRDGHDAVVAPPQPQAFADAIVRLYSDKQQWEKLSCNAGEAIVPFTPHSVHVRLRHMLDQVTLR